MFEIFEIYPQIPSLKLTNILNILFSLHMVVGKRGLVLSRSTFVGSGRWVAHWLGDNFSNWSNLRASVIGMLQFNQVFKIKGTVYCIHSAIFNQLKF